jgi:uncharacterized protein YecE (DUF72 family)
MTRVLVGCCGFPCSRPQYYKRFETVEVQSTFYRLPRPETASRWREEAPGGFVFTFKAFQALTHPTTSPTWRRSGLSPEELRGKEFGWLRPTEDNLRAWRETAEIGRLMGARVCVVQCPPNFRCTEENAENLRRFFRRVRREFAVAWEPRGDWGEHPDLIRELCRELDLLHCVDPLRSDPLHFGSARIAYFRLHGFGRPSMYNYRYSREELERLRERAEGLKGKVREIYFMFNNVHMLEDALRLRELLGQVGPNG